MVHSGGLTTNEKHVWRKLYERCTMGLPAAKLEQSMRGNYTQGLGARVRAIVSRRVWFMYGRETLQYLAESGMLTENTIANMQAMMRMIR